MNLLLWKVKRKDELISGDYSSIRGGSISRIISSGSIRCTSSIRYTSSSTSSDSDSTSSNSNNSSSSIMVNLPQNLS